MVTTYFCHNGKSLSLVLLLILLPSLSWAYRPLDSTDAAVIDPKTVEVELGYVTLERDQGENTFTIPELAINYGVTKTLEVGGEFGVEKPPDDAAQFVDPALFLKAVLRQGVLQEKTGVSLAMETALLLPSSSPDARDVGFEGIGILSLQPAPLTFHINAGGGINRASEAFAVWGLIAEFPTLPSLRLVGEISGERVKGNPIEHTGLLGLIWTSPWSNLSFDVGLRWGLSNAAPDWQFTAGLTFGFPSPTSSP